MATTTPLSSATARNGARNLPYEPKTCVIYAMRNIYTKHIYIGLTRKGMDARWNEHHRRLRDGSHLSPNMRQEYKQYGRESFEMYMVEDDTAYVNAHNLHDETASDYLRQREMYWIAKLRPLLNSYQDYDIRAAEATRAVISREWSADDGQLARGLALLLVSELGIGLVDIACDQDAAGQVILDIAVTNARGAKVLRLMLPDDLRDAGYGAVDVAVDGSNIQFVIEVNDDR